MSNNRYYTPEEVNAIFSHVFNKVDFSTPNLTRDIGCSPHFSIAPDEVKKLLNIITSAKKALFLDLRNSHDWVKILKHVFQNGQIINFNNQNAMHLWHQFSRLSRECCLNANNQESSIDYTLQMKNFITNLIIHGTFSEAQCIHQLFYFAQKIYSHHKLTMSSGSIASMLGAVLYDGLHLNGRIRVISLEQLDVSQVQSYSEELKGMTKLLAAIIEEPFFSNSFQIEQYLNIAPVKEELFSDFKAISFFNGEKIRAAINFESEDMEARYADLKTTKNKKRSSLTNVFK